MTVCECRSKRWKSAQPIHILHLLAIVLNRLTHMLLVGEVGRMPAAAGVGMPVRCVVHVSMMVGMAGVHRGGMVLHVSLLVSLSYGNISRGSGGLRAPGWGSVLGAVLWKGLELCERDNRRRSWCVLSPGGRSSSEQGRLGLLSPVLKCLSLVGVRFKCILG